MIFLAILIIATAGTAAAVRSWDERRTIARIGLGVALALAGGSHFVNPTPFEQHLPSWVPAPALMVALSGVAEVTLGAALVARWPTAIAIGRTVAAFFVAVFPANVYVAVADVDVDGQPGGLYPWIRLPLQLLFVAWALWSTQPVEAEDNPPHRGVLPPLRWRTGPGASAVGSGAETVVMASVLELQRVRDAPGFLVAALRLRRLFATSPGAIRLSLVAIPLRTTFWTLSQWTSQADLDAYARHPAHIDIVSKYSTRMSGSTFSTWTEPTGLAPSWKRARTQIAAAKRASPAGHR